MLKREIEEKDKRIEQMENDRGRNITTVRATAANTGAGDDIVNFKRAKSGTNALLLNKPVQDAYANQRYSKKGQTIFAASVHANYDKEHKTRADIYDGAFTHPEFDSFNTRTKLLELRQRQIDNQDRYR